MANGENSETIPSVASRDVWITGIGIVSSLGEGRQAHLAALDGDNASQVDTDTFAPYRCIPCAAGVGKADSQKGRPAPDGELAEAGRLRSWSCA